jgi:hypothetical protein
MASSSAILISLRFRSCSVASTKELPPRTIIEAPVGSRLSHYGWPATLRESQRSSAHADRALCVIVP